ncbi:two pore domain potassium channel family protein [Synechococcus sp. RSCCF101]|uniref:potassium channel family protein n=1 Tax=Synechococcus sp. RSCCF101 TaxID=2511069 RepID=UPI001248EEDD|nr:potassium channel family protein [Synechococcus sp. RSCCF101]QEY31960.1 two pore domain potassium channel family protein [Synechococcus sp. RSCCF101]
MRSSRPRPPADDLPLPSRRQHRLYRMLLAIEVALLIAFAFQRLSWFVGPGYTLLALVMGFLENSGTTPRLRRSTRLYRTLGVSTLVAMWIWLLTPVKLLISGLPLVVLLALYVGWSVMRLVERLAQERQVTGDVLTGAAAGYLLLGLASALLVTTLETIQPGSFSSLLSEAETARIQEGFVQEAAVIRSTAVFTRLNYFAFVCLSTVGFGDITPSTPPAQMLSVAISVIGPLYLAVVMGVLIGRYAQPPEPSEPQGPDQIDV